MDEISSQMMGHLSHAISTHYTASEIETLFLSAGAPDRPPESNKAKTVLAFLRAVNKQSAAPKEVLGKILEQFLSKEEPDVVLKRDQAKAVKVLREEGFELGKGGALRRAARRRAPRSPWLSWLRRRVCWLWIRKFNGH